MSFFVHVADLLQIAKTYLIFSASDSLGVSRVVLDRRSSGADYLGWLGVGVRVAWS